MKNVFLAMDDCAIITEGGITMPQSTVSPEQLFNGSHCVFMYVALLSALLG